MFQRLRRFHVDRMKVPFLHDLKGGDRDDNARINELRGYVSQHVRVVEIFEPKLNVHLGRNTHVRRGIKAVVLEGGRS